MKNFLSFAVTLLIFFNDVYAQQATQTIKGQLIDAQSKSPLIGASVVILGSDPLIGTTSNVDGEYKITNAPLGRITLKVSYLGYEEKVIPNVLVTSGKEVILNLDLQESIITGEEVVVTAERKDKASTNNEMATVSARTFNVEETNRYAGSRNDVARMASNFAGVSGANDSRNDIIIRGNSPVGLLWRLEGINIPNPSHYGSLGSTGGPVSLLNTNVLDKSDFMTAAFPAEYGNAIAGVFDLQLGEGNNEKREYLGQIGFNGFELGAEGPFSKKGKASYLVNYRYSTLGVFQALGLEFGTGTATPQYQDLSFKINVPTEKSGTFSVWGIGGISNIDLLGSEIDTTSSNLYGGENDNFFLKYKTGVVGVSHKYYFNNSTYSKLSVAASKAYQQFEADSITITERAIIRNEKAEYNQDKYSVNLLINKKFNARNTVNGGVIVDLYDFDLQYFRLRKSTGEFKAIQNKAGQAVLSQAYAQWQHRFNDKFTLNSGVNLQHFSVSNKVALEPRVGLRYKVTPRRSFNLGYGYHSQMQPLLTYFSTTYYADGTTATTNEDMNFTKSQHFVLGYENAFAPSLRLKLETYYQYITKAPVENYSSSFSMLNAGADFVTPENDSLVNKGTGRNYGIELTLEKFYSQGYYFLLTTSLFDSKYKGSDNVERNTTFNGNYAMNILAGKEFKLGKKKINTFNLDWKLTTAGGRYVTPLDFEKSAEAGQEVYKNDQAFSEKLSPYFRTDIKFSFRMNKKKLTHEFSLDLQNVLNTKNVFMQRYNARTNSVETEYQIGFFPIPQYRVLF